MLALQLLRPEVVVQLRPFPLKDPHELVYLDFEAIEVASVELVVLVIHEVFEDGIAGVGIIRHLEDVLAEVVHALEIAVIWMVVGKGPEDFYHLHSELLVPAKRSPGIEVDDFSVLSELWDLVDHAQVYGFGEGRIADVQVELQSDLTEQRLILLKDKVALHYLIA